MEDLKIYGPAGKVVRSLSLTDAKGPLLILRAAGGVEVAETAAEGSQVIAALVRDEDGWTLASADPAVPVACGGKSAGALPLVPGAACRAGDFIFRIETDAVASGNVLLWRVGKSSVAAEAVLSGRNCVAGDTLHDGAPTVNPAMAGTVLFEFYPTLDGLDVVMPDGTRTSIGRRLCFAVGAFQGLLLTAAEATEALKTRDPFGYPSGGTRRRLLAATLGAGLLCLGAAYLWRGADRLERLAQEPRGAVREEGPKVAAEQAYFGDDYVYMLAFYRDLPLVLGARPSPVAADLIARAANYRDKPDVQRAARFLTDVTEIQKAIPEQRWDDLSNRLSRVDREMFALAGGRRFLDDAREILTCADVYVPQSALRYCAAKPAERAKQESEFAALMEGMRDNLFIVSSVMDGWMRRVESNAKAMEAFLACRDRVLAAPKVSAADVQELCRLLTEFDRSGGGVLPDLQRQIRVPLAEYAEKKLTELFAKFHAATDYDGGMTAIRPLCDLAADCGVEAKKLSDWRRRAKEMDRLVESHLAQCYQRYRLADGPDVAQKALAELLAVDDPSNRYHVWAVKEKARLDAEVKK